MQQFNLRLLQKNSRSLASVVMVVNKLFILFGNVPAYLKDRRQNEWIKTGKTMTQLFHFSNRQCLANHDRNRKEIEENKELIKNLSVFTELQFSPKTLAAVR